HLAERRESHMVEANDHPSPELLSDFALGKLDEEQIAIVACHLSDCAACSDTAASTTDSFLDLLRPDPGDPHDALNLPDTLRNHCRYRIIRALGRGGMGSVYLAEHRIMKQLLAIKVINPALIANPRAAERFVREIDVLTKLRHPAIVQGFDGEEAGGLYLLVMEYVAGESLAQILERQGPLPVSTACEYARQVALGLQYAHEQGLVHRDIKPANLMLTSAGKIKILDFGLARLASEAQAEKSGLTHEHAAMGTPDYSAPEQALDARNADICADIYSLGCTLFCLLTAKPPFGRPSALAVSVAHLQELPPSLRELRPDAPAGLCELVQRMLAKLPGQRPQTPGEVAACLAQFIVPGTPAGEEQPAALLKATIPAWRRRGVLWVAVTVAFLSAVALIGWGAAVDRVRAPRGPIVREQVPAPAEDFVPLFDGKSLAGWQKDGGDERQWQVEDGAIVGRCNVWAERGYILSEKEYGDFGLRFEFTVEDRGTSAGVTFRAVPGESLPFPDGQLQFEHPLLKLAEGRILGTTHWVKDDKAGCPPTQAVDLAVGEWHMAELTVRGDRCVFVAGGSKVVDLKLDAGAEGDIAALKRSRGRIGFQVNGGVVRIRSVRVRTLSPGSKAKP
ncbi:MAG TPA: protein kinase, partial [Gemmataceae bacterium]|nr:protein kinase [Gemmataceae bacterium]